MKKQFSSILPTVLAVLVLSTVVLTMYYTFRRGAAGAVQVTEAVVTAEDQTAAESLPAVLAGLPHGTKVTVTFTLEKGMGDTLFFGTVYSPLTIRANGREIYTYGEAGTYPPFFGDPPTHYDSVNLPAVEKTEICMEYFSPNERSSLSIHAPVVGSENAVMRYLMAENGLLVAAALFFLFLGAVLIVISLFFLRGEDHGRVLLLPGMLSLFAGAWQLGENAMAVYLMEAPSLMYAMDFLGLFLLVIPVYRMGLHYLRPRTHRLLKGILVLMEVSVLSAVVLQLTGTVSFHRSLYYFHVLLPLALLVLSGCALDEYIRSRSSRAGLFFVPFLILAVSAVAELVNYRLRFFPKYSALFQAGLFLFVISMAAFSGVSLRSLYTLRIRNLELENEVKLQEQTIAAQKKHSEMLLGHYEEIRRQRHDIRHHLRTLSDLIRRGESPKALEYIRSLADTVPDYSPERWCENDAVNATLSCYAQMAREKGIRLDIRTQIPRGNTGMSDTGLCVIFGNLFENALEACLRMRDGNRFISLRSAVKGENLFIAMDNSFDGDVRMTEEGALSSKRPGEGTGLRSVRSLAEANRGSASFRAMGNVFRSEVYVRL